MPYALLEGQVDELAQARNMVRMQLGTLRIVSIVALARMDLYSYGGCGVSQRNAVDGRRNVSIDPCIVMLGQQYLAVGHTKGPCKDGQTQDQLTLCACLGSFVCAQCSPTTQWYVHGTETRPRETVPQRDQLVQATAPQLSEDDPGIKLVSIVSIANKYSLGGVWAVRYGMG
jgi:hypothetical protein